MAARKVHCKLTAEQEIAFELSKIKPRAPKPVVSKRKGKKPARLEAKDTADTEFESESAERFQDLLGIKDPGLSQVKEVEPPQISSAQ